MANSKYHPKKDPNRPIFEVGEILRNYEKDETEIDLMLRKLNFSIVLTKGGIIEISLTWMCNYDFLFGNPCKPIVKFYRFDIPFKDKSASSGFNFRYLIY